jgi:hypothetical protein
MKQRGPAINNRRVPNEIKRAVGVLSAKESDRYAFFHVAKSSFIFISHSFSRIDTINDVGKGIVSPMRGG